MFLLDEKETILLDIFFLVKLEYYLGIGYYFYYTMILLGLHSYLLLPLDEDASFPKESLYNILSHKFSQISYFSFFPVAISLFLFPGMFFFLPLSFSAFSSHFLNLLFSFSSFFSPSLQSPPLQSSFLICSLNPLSSLFLHSSLYVLSPLLYPLHSLSFLFLHHLINISEKYYTFTSGLLTSFCRKNVFVCF